MMDCPDCHYNVKMKQSWKYLDQNSEMRVLFGLLTLGVVVFMESSALGNIKSPLPAPEVIFTPPRITSIMNIYMRYIENLAFFNDGLY